MPEFEARYSVYALGIKLGEAVRRLKALENGRFLFESNSHATGIVAMVRDDTIRERSVWRYHENDIQPLEYAYHHEGSKKQRHLEIFFDWEKMSARNVVKGDPWHLSLKPGTLDKLVYQIALMRDLQAGKRDIAYTVADGGRLKHYAVDFEGEEEVKTSLGTFKTLKFIRVSNRNHKRISILWCAKALSYLPVRVEHQEPGGETIFMEIDTVDGLKPSQAVSLKGGN